MKTDLAKSLSPRDERASPCKKARVDIGPDDTAEVESCSSCGTPWHVQEQEEWLCNDFYMASNHLKHDVVEDESTYEKFERGIVEADLAKVEEAIHQEVMQDDHFRWGEDDDDDWVTQLLGFTDPVIRQRSGFKLTPERVDLLKLRAESGFLQAALRALFDHGFDFVYCPFEEYGCLPASACAKLAGLPAIEFLLEQMALEQKWRPKCTSVHVKKRHELWEAKRKAREAYDWDEHDRRCEHGGMA